MKTILEYLFSKKSDLDKIRANIFGITEKDMIRALEGFPVGVVMRMMEEQKNQGNKPDVKVFQRAANADSSDGGFHWDDTEDGYEFWEAVINFINFNKFYKKHPEYKKYNI